MGSLRSVALSCLVVLGLFAACSDDSPSQTPDTSTPDASTPDASVSDASMPEMCTPEGTTRCGDSCVNTGTDPAHCGGCDQACTAAEDCTGGVCVAVCRIGGVTFAAGAVNPANACEVCAPATSTTTWTPRASIPLLVGGEDLATQGWTTVGAAPNSLTYGEGYVRLETSTASGKTSGGYLLIARANTVDPTQPFKLRVTLQVEAVNRHNQLDSGAAILGSLTGQAGSSTERGQMLYLDPTAVGWADDSQSAAFVVTDGAYHVHELAVDAAKVATVSVDGVAKLTRANFTTNGTLAIGDQTNDPNVDGALRIQSVEKLCP